METPKRRRVWFVGLSLGVLLALFVWPATRSLIRTQFALALGRADGMTLFSNRPLPEVAERHPSDYPIQLAEAILEAGAMPNGNGTSRSERTLQRLDALKPQFSNSPSLYANLVRFAFLGAVTVNRQDEEAKVSDDPGLRQAHRAVRRSPDLLAHFDQAAAEGERLDSENAYFPFMRAVGLFAAHRDADALDAIRRAAAKPRWEEYYMDELVGGWRLQAEAFGDQGVVPRVASAAMILFPQYSQVRAAARVAVAHAVEAEQAGQVEEGLAIRHAVMECGSRLRVQSRSLIGATIGIALTRIAMLRPGGAPLIPRDKPGVGITAPDNGADRQLQAYEEYLRRIGCADEIGRVGAEFAAGSQARGVMKRSLDYSPLSRPLWKLITVWIVSLIVLSGALWMLALAGSAALLARSRRIQNGQALPGYAQRGLVPGLLVGTAGVVTALFWKADLPVLCLLITVLVGPVALLTPVFSRVDRLRSLGVFALSAAGVLLLAGALAWQVNTSVGPFVQMAQLLGGGVETGVQSDAHVAMVLSAWLIVSVPLLTLLTLGLLSLLCRVPLSVGLTRGLRGCAVPVACLLFLVYGGLVSLTQRQERIIDEGLAGMLQHEGAYLAGLIGEKWPGPVR